MEDRLLRVDAGGVARRLRLHWLLGEGAWASREAAQGAHVVEGEGVRLEVRLGAGCGAGRGLVHRLERGEASPPSGWYSRTYGRRVAATSAVFEFESEGDVVLESLFVLGEGAR